MMNCSGSGEVGPQFMDMLASNLRLGLSEEEEASVFLTGQGPCQLCGPGATVSAVRRNFSPALRAAAVEPPYPGARCMCRGPHRVPGVVDQQLVAVYNMWLKMEAKAPWAKLRMVHVLRIEAPWIEGGWQYVQIYGGSGQAAPAIRIARSEREVEDEYMYYNRHAEIPDRRVMLQAELEQDVSPLTLPSYASYHKAGARPRDPSKAMIDQMSPLFSIVVISKEGGSIPGTYNNSSEGVCMRQYQPDADALAALHVIIAGIITALDVIEPVAGSPPGDDRQFYPMRKEFVAEGSEIFSGALAAQRKATVSFPFTQKRKVMSTPQFHAVAGAWTSAMDSGEEPPRSAAASDYDYLALAVHNASLIKAEANKEFGRCTAEGYSNAHQMYTEALQHFPMGTAKCEPVFEDEEVQTEYDKIRSNRVLCSRRLSNWHRTIEEGTEMIGCRLEGALVVKSLNARATAYVELGRLESAITDYYGVLRHYSTSFQWKDWRNLTAKVGTLEARLNISTADSILSWRRLKPTGDLPGPRVFHTAVCWKSKFYLYGGHATMGQALQGNTILPEKHDKITGSTDVWILDIEKMHWTRKATTGVGPGGLSKHQARVRDGQMYVFGGDMMVMNGRAEYRDRRDKCFHALNLDTLVWKPVIELNDGPSRLQEHGSVVYGSRFYVLGGNSLRGNHKHDGLCKSCSKGSGFFSFDFETSKWRKEPLPGGRNCPAPEEIESTAICLQGHRVVVYGGRLPNNTYSGELYFYDILQQKWNSGRDVNGTWPIARAETQSVTLGNSVVLHGGYSESPGVGSRYLSDSFRLYIGSNKSTWQRSGKSDLGTGSDEPSPGCRAASSLTQLGSVTSRAILYGGYEAKSLRGRMHPVLDDMWEVTISRRPDKSLNITPCSCCGEIGVWKKCSSCLGPAYCSRKCQREAWPTHKAECKKRTKSE